ncbi:stability/ partitioning determinant [Citrobacter sp. NCU1]|uniref:stability/ partitioning determinant n=1 Tax=Citrobacter sp. NCU1 TaxID=2026683 RepID=UPI001877F8A1|nr:stability/ partitioning determinant [Citrobacter sp. NCU1]
MAGLKLKVPTIPVPVAAATDKNESETNSSANVARFISDGDRRPASGKALPKNFRLQQVFIDIMDEGATSTGLGQTDILKAALAAFQKMDENEKNYWILESKKL